MIGGQSAVRMNSRHNFPVGGLVELSRATYESTPDTEPNVFQHRLRYRRHNYPDDCRRR
jgi:hypothetical protein